MQVSFIPSVKNATEESAARVKRTCFLGTINFNIIKYTSDNNAASLLNASLTPVPVEHAPRM